MSTETTNQPTMNCETINGSFIEEFFTLLQNKYNYNKYESTITNMNRLLTMRKGSETDSILYIETEILMLFQMVVIFKKKLNNLPSNTEIKEKLDYFRTQLSTQIELWTDLQG